MLQQHYRHSIVKCSHPAGRRAGAIVLQAARAAHIPQPLGTLDLVEPRLLEVAVISGPLPMHWDTCALDRMVAKKGGTYGTLWHSEISACLKIGYPQNYCLIIIIIIITIFWQVPAHVAASSPKLMQCMTRVELDSWYSLTVYQADLLPHPQTKQKMCWPICSTVLHAELGQTVLTRSFSGGNMIYFITLPKKR